MKTVKCKLYGTVSRDFCKGCSVPKQLRNENCPHFQSISFDKHPQRGYEKKEYGRQVA